MPETLCQSAASILLADRRIADSRTIINAAETPCEMDFSAPMSDEAND